MLGEQYLAQGLTGLSRAHGTGCFDGHEGAAQSSAVGPAPDADTPAGCRTFPPPAHRRGSAPPFAGDHAAGISLGGFT